VSCGDIRSRIEEKAGEIRDEEMMRRGSVSLFVPLTMDEKCRLPFFSDRLSTAQ